jgi:aspartate--ammonia ligase
MHALRPDYKLDNTHTVSVDQWDWELAITEEQRNLEFLKDVVRKIYTVFKCAQQYICQEYPILASDEKQLWSSLPDKITFIHSEDLLHEYPKLDQKSREKEALKKCGAAFIVRNFEENSYFKNR